ncbi:hypothetical protein KSP40_PGU017447 [Platanthera guangdongensis]|uniref:Uncharacterized protein n=1 Tax=Platanthera guangdongensis TaxID=2320717 RepID=A0ABR2M7H7_9ASPA
MATDAHRILFFPILLIIITIPATLSLSPAHLRSSLSHRRRLLLRQSLELTAPPPFSTSHPVSPTWSRAATPRCRRKAAALPRRSRRKHPNLPLPAPLHLRLLRHQDRHHQGPDAPHHLPCPNSPYLGIPVASPGALSPAGGGGGQPAGDSLIRSGTCNPDHRNTEQRQRRRRHLSCRSSYSAGRAGHRRPSNLDDLLSSDEFQSRLSFTNSLNSLCTALDLFQNKFLFF